MLVLIWLQINYRVFVIIINKYECRYIESKPKHWNPKHSVLVKDIENMNKMKMGLYVQHTMNHQNYGEKSSRRSELVLELKKIFESLHLKYNLLPQEVHLTQFNMVTNASNTHLMTTTPWWFPIYTPNYIYTSINITLINLSFWCVNFSTEERFALLVMKIIIRYLFFNELSS